MAGGLTPRSLREKFATMQMMDVFIPTEEAGKQLLFPSYTQPEKDHQVLLARLGWEPPTQPRSESASAASCSTENHGCSSACLQ